MNARAPDLPEVHFSEEEGVRHLHLGGTPWVQGSMRLRAPFDLELEYVQRMMAWLLLAPPDVVPGGHAMQLGLGAGSITKFCHKKLGMTCTAIEINPAVLAACRGWFRLPADGPRLRVVLADAAAEIRRDEWLGSVDALAIDLYDQNAAAPLLDSAGFYADARALLTEGGAMTVNLFGRAASFERSLKHLGEAFGDDALWTFKPTREGNTVVLAQRHASRPRREALAARAAQIESQWALPASKWLRVFRPLVK